MNLTNIIKCHTRIYQKILIYLEINFTNNFQITFQQQIIIRQNASCNRIFNGHQTSIAKGFVTPNLHYIAKSGTTNYFYLIPKKFAGRSLVKAAFKSLY